MKDKITDNISEALDADFVPEETQNELVVRENESTELVAPEVSPENTKKKQEAEDDYQAARKLAHRTAQSLEKALDHLDGLGAQMETGAFWTAYAQVIDKANNTSKDMLEIQQKKDSLASFVDDPDEPADAGINIENAVVYTGTISDMQRDLKRQALEEDEKVIDVEE